MIRLLLALGLIADFSLRSASTFGQGTLTQIGLAGENIGLTRRLAAIDSLVNAGKWPEVADEYVRILDEAGDDLAPLEPRRSVSLRHLCHQRLAAFPPEALRLYRQRAAGRVR